MRAFAKFKPMSFLTEIFLWLCRAVFFTALVMGVGGVLGMLLYPLGALVFGTGARGWSGVVLLGLQHGQQWTGVWAGGLAFVFCWMEWRARWWARSARSPRN